MSGGELATLLSRAAARWGERPAMHVGEGDVLSFAELEYRAARFAGGLTKRGVKPGDRVILYLPNGWEWVVAYHACARMGAVVIPANILLSMAEIRFMAADSGARAIIAPDATASVQELGLELAITLASTSTTVSMTDLLASAPLSPLNMRGDALLSIGYTSGTTGSPKGVMLRHDNVAGSVAHTATCHVRHAHDRIFSALPFPHVYGNVVLNASLLTGGFLFAPPRFEAGAALASIGEQQITMFEGVPAMYYQMLANPLIETADFGSLSRCTVGGQTMPLAKLEQLATHFGCPILELWGMTELSGPAITHSPFWPARHGSIGLPFPGMDARLVDLDDPRRDAAPGAPGELCVRGPLVMAGYWNNPAATSEAVDQDGWLSTGDVATRDSDGYFYIVDRRKDMILTAGYNVYPAELEQAIASHPAVAMVAVAGFPDEMKGELAHAFVVARPGMTIDTVDLLSYCRRLLAAYKIPRAVHVVADLPRTSSGKIMRRALHIPEPAHRPTH